MQQYMAMEAKMSKWWAKVVASIALILASLMGAMFTSDAVHAEDDGSVDAGYFNIYAWVQSCSYYNYEPVAGSCSQGSGSITSSAQVTVNSNGTYAIKNEQRNNAISLRIRNNTLTITPTCALFNVCPSTVSVELRGGAASVRAAVNNALRGVEWNKTEGALGSTYYTTTRYTFSATDVTKIEDVQIGNDLATDLGIDNDGTNITTTPNCMSEAGTTLGWILCPISDALNGAAGWAYDSLLKPALEINPQLFTQESTSSTTGTSATTQQAWDVFRNIANTLFIILFLVVIFSQLTGVGIDNYGIKKILPKLIVAAVLMNLSYWICLVFVDLSNILGNSLQSLLTNLPPANNQLPETVGGVDFGERFWEGLGGVATFVAVLGVLAGGVGVSIMAAGGGVAFLISILVAGLGAVVGIFFLFLLLAAREAAIVVLVVISPLAFACNMLPNTQDLFKKWWQIGWKLLLVYPIAGLLIGGGDYVSRLLLLSGAGGEGFFSAFAAIIVGIVPIFFIPSVLKSSFAAMGNLGAKISGIGQKVGGQLSGATDKTIRGSERFKNYQSDRDRQRKIESARRTAARFEGRDPNSLSGRQQRAFTQARSILLGEEAEERKRGSLLNGGYEAAMAGIEESALLQQDKDRTALIDREYGGEGLNQLMARWRTARDNGNEADLGAFTSVINQRFGARGVNQIAQAVGEIDENHAHYGAMVNSLRRTMNNNSAFAGNLSKTGDAFDMIANGGVGTDGRQHGLSYFTQNMQGGSVSSASDWATQTNATLQRAVESNALSNDMINELLNSNDPTIQSKLQGDPSKRDTLQAALYDRAHGVDPNRGVAASAAAYRSEQQAAAQAAQQAQQSQQDQMAQNLQNINDILSQHGGGGNP